eukprot:jgi/Mesen1/2967/ME000176S02009
MALIATAPFVLPFPALFDSPARQIEKRACRAFLKTSLPLQRCNRPSSVDISTCFFGQRIKIEKCSSFQYQRSTGVKRGGITMVLKESQKLELGSPAPDFELVEPLTGKTWTLSDFEGYPGLLVMFICNHCPFVIHLKKDLAAIGAEYMQKGLGVVAISSNSVESHPQDGPDLMAEDAKRQGYQFPYLFDETQEVAKAYKAACTPDFYIFKKEGRRPFELAYHGQMDDSRPNNGKPITGADLRAAMECVLSGRPTPSRQRPSIGCNIKWTPGNEPEWF